MDTSDAVATRIKELCKAKDISMYKLSILSGVPHTTLISIMNGSSKNPGIVTLKKICDAFGVSLCEFFDSTIF